MRCQRDAIGCYIARTLGRVQENVSDNQTSEKKKGKRERSRRRSAAKLSALAGLPAPSVTHTSPITCGRPNGGARPFGATAPGTNCPPYQCADCRRRAAGGPIGGGTDGVWPMGVAASRARPRAAPLGSQRAAPPQPESRNGRPALGKSAAVARVMTSQRARPDQAARAGPSNSRRQ